MNTILMMSAKMATPGLLKIKVFSNKGFEIKVLGLLKIKVFWNKGFEIKVMTS